MKLTNVAVTLLAAAIVTVHVPVPLQPARLQPLKVDPAAGVAVRVTEAPAVNAAAQVGPQLIPAGDEVTVPVPVPARTTARAWVPAGTFTTCVSVDDVLAR